MKILAFSNCPLDPVLGSGRTRLAWASGLTALGHEVMTVQIDELLGEAVEDVLGRRLRLGWQGWRWLRKHDLSDIDVIEFYGAEFWPGTWRLAAQQGRRPLLVAHTDGLEMLAAERLEAAPQPIPVERRPAWRKAAAALLSRPEKLAFSRADGFVAGCDLDCRYLRQHAIGNPARMEAIPPGLEPGYLDLPFRAGRENRIAFLGSWIPRKGINHLLATLIPLLRARPGLALDLFGIDINTVDPLAHFPAEIHRQIVVHPRLSIAELIARISRAKVYFFPSEYEGFGLGLAEAMACGCAAVTTPTGFGADLLAGQEALICDFGAVAEMRAAIERLLDDEPARISIAEAGWRRVQELRWEKSVRRLESTYRRWAAEVNPQPRSSCLSPL